MFSINEAGYLVDEMGFPINSQGLEKVALACRASLGITTAERINHAKQHCQERFPAMILQLNWERFK